MVGSMTFMTFMTVKRLVFLGFLEKSTCQLYPHGFHLFEIAVLRQLSRHLLKEGTIHTHGHQTWSVIEPN